jgi:hypothetical protein
VRRTRAATPAGPVTAALADHARLALALGVHDAHADATAGRFEARSLKCEAVGRQALTGGERLLKARAWAFGALLWGTSAWALGACGATASHAEDGAMTAGTAAAGRGVAGAAP